MHLRLCNNVIIVVGPLVTLCHHRLQSLFLTFRRIFVFLQQPFHQYAHLGTSRLLAIPVNGAVAAKLLCQLTGKCNKLLVGVSLAYSFR